MRTVCFFTETPVSKTAYSTTFTRARSQTNPFPRPTRTRFQTAKTPENDINLVVDGVYTNGVLTWNSVPPDLQESSPLEAGTAAEQAPLPQMDQLRRPQGIWVGVQNT